MKTELKRHPHLVVRKSAVHGYGVYSDTDIAKGEIIEECYAITTDQNDMGEPFTNFVFGDGVKRAIPLGFGCIYNHSYSPNAEFFFHEKEPIVIFEAIRPIKKGEEIFVSYGDSWFDERSFKAIGYDAFTLKQRIKRFMRTLLRFSVIVGLLFVVRGLSLMMFKFT